MTSFWLAFYWIGIPLAAIAVVVAIVHNIRLTYGQPELQGHLLFHSDSVRAQSGLMIGSPPFRLRITDREIVFRVRPGYRSGCYGGIETRIPVEHIAYLVRLPDETIRLGLTGGEERHWDLSAEDPRLFRVLETLRLPHP